ncbi:MAG: DUF1015 family protein [Actinomycetota bacterium]
MPRIAPFVGLRYDVAVAGPLADLVAPPYDMVGDEALAALVARSPHNVARLERGTSGGTDAEYRAAAEDLTSWRRDRVLTRTTEGLVAYEMTFRLHGRVRSVRGVIGAVDLEPWGGRIVPHEHVMPGPLEDRLRVLRTVRANLSPVHAILPGPSPVLGATLTHICADAPHAEVVDAGVTHRAWWFVPEADLLAEIAEQRCMIADGHHRYTTALAFREEMRSAAGPGPWDAILMLLVDATEEPPVLPFHRVVAAPPPAVAGTGVRDLDAVLAAVDDESLRVGLVTRGDELVYRIVTLDGHPPAAAALEPLLPQAPDAVTFVQSARDAERSIAAGDAAAAWILPATSAMRIRAVVDAGARLPRKTTYFWPKPLTGIVIRPLD